MFMITAYALCSKLYEQLLVFWSLLHGFGIKFPWGGVAQLANFRKPSYLRTEGMVKKIICFERDMFSRSRLVWQFSTVTRKTLYCSNSWPIWWEAIAWNRLYASMIMMALESLQTFVFSCTSNAMGMLLIFSYFYTMIFGTSLVP